MILGIFFQFMTAIFCKHYIKVKNSWPMDLEFLKIRLMINYYSALNLFM